MIRSHANQKDYKKFLSKIINEQAIPDKDKRESVKLNLESVITERESAIKDKITIGYSILISLLFLASYCILIYSLYTIFYAEIDLIKDGLLKAEDRSLNSTAVSALIAGTVTQTGVAFFAVTRYVFNKKAS